MRAIFEALSDTLLKTIEKCKPENFIRDKLRCGQSALIVDGKEHRLRDTYLVGFGKAVGGMVPHICSQLGPHLKKGIVSVPKG